MVTAEDQHSFTALYLFPFIDVYTSAYKRKRGNSVGYYTLSPVFSQPRRKDFPSEDIEGTSEDE